MGSCIDLRDQMENESVHDAFSKLVSGGKMGYKTVIERKKDLPKCPNPQCGVALRGEEKFCPECGAKIVSVKA